MVNVLVKQTLGYQTVRMFRKIFCHVMGIVGWVILAAILWYAVINDGVVYLVFNDYSEMWFEFWYAHVSVVVMSIFTIMEMKEIKRTKLTLDDQVERCLSGDCVK